MDNQEKRLAAIKIITEIEICAQTAREFLNGGNDLEAVFRQFRERVNPLIKSSDLITEEELVAQRQKHARLIAKINEDIDRSIADPYYFRDKQPKINMH